MRTAFQVFKLAKGSVTSDQYYVKISWEDRNYAKFEYHTVDVSGTASVVTGECRLEVHDTVGVTLLDTAKES